MRKLFVRKMFAFFFLLRMTFSLSLSRVKSRFWQFHSTAGCFSLIFAMDSRRVSDSLRIRNFFVLTVSSRFCCCQQTNEFDLMLLPHCNSLYDFWYFLVCSVSFALISWLKLRWQYIFYFQMSSAILLERTIPRAIYCWTLLVCPIWLYNPNSFESIWITNVEFFFLVFFSESNDKGLGTKQNSAVNTETMSLNFIFIVAICS